MESVVLEQEPARADRSADPAARQNGDSVLAIMRSHDLLGLLSERDLVALARQCPVKTLPKNRVLFRTGDQGHSVVLVLQGYIKLSTMAANGREVVLEIAAPGSIFGEIAVLTDSSRRADATTLTTSRVMAIDGAHFRRALAASSEAMFAAIRLLSERLSAVTMREMDSVALPASVRLAKALLRLAQQHSGRLEDGAQIGFRLSQRELGAMTGLIRESINKHLKAWRAAGWVELSGGSVTLRDVRALQEFVHDSEPRH
jgi:CRP-like cAMP-binding protein